VVDEIKMKVNMLTTQLDYQERKELQTAVIKQREKNKEAQKQALKEVSKDIAPNGVPKKKFKWSDVGHFILKNFKWIAIIILAVATVLILIIGGKDAFKSITDFYKSIFGG
jgi:CRISPR/Cas system-associated protein Csx1